MTSLFSARQLDGIVAELKIEEGFRAHCYKCPSGKHTIGFGRNIDEAGGLGITEDEALDLLENDVMRCLSEVKRWPWFDALKPVHQNVIISMSYVLGHPSLSGFVKMLGAIEQGDMNTAADELLDSRFARQVPARAARLARQLRN